MMMSLFLKTLAGEKHSPPPMWLMRQAGRYLPEYRQLRQKQPSFLQFCYSPDNVVEATLQPIERYDFDAAIIFSDILIIPDALGLEVQFQEGEGPVIEKIFGKKDIDKLSLSNVVEHLAPVFEGIRQTRAQLAPDKALIGFCGAPWTLACYMISGRNINNFYDARRFCCQHPDILRQLLDIVGEAIVICLKAQIEAGIDAIQIFDSWAGLLSYDGFADYVIAPTAKIIRQIRKEHPKVPIIGFPRGAGNRAAAYAEQTGITALQCDEMQDMASLARNLPQTVLQGNLDPLVLLGSDDGIVENVRRIKRQMRDHAFVFNLGHGISKDTDPEKVKLLVNIVRETG